MPDKFLDILPDLDYSITDAGFPGGSGDDTGQGFVSVSLASIQTVSRDTTIGGYLVNRTNAYHKWLIDLKYNPLTLEQFSPIYNFIMQKKGSLEPFYVSLPQHKAPKNALFAAYVQGETISTVAANQAGVHSMLIGTWAGNDYSDGLPSFGDLFTIDDPNDSLHTKAYMINRVETYSDYLSGNQPTSTNIRIHFTPGLQRYTYSGSEIIFNNPLIRVEQLQDIQEYSLGYDNLYSFALKLQETFY